MAAFKPLREFFAYAAAALCLVLPGCIAAQSTAGAQNQDEEVQMGQEVFNELKAKGEIIESSPLYDQLKPIASVITSKAANSYQFKTGQRKWPSRTEIVLPCRLLWWQVGFSAPAPRAALEHVPVV